MLRQHGMALSRQAWYVCGILFLRVFVCMCVVMMASVKCAELPPFSGVAKFERAEAFIGYPEHRFRMAMG